MTKNDEIQFFSDDDVPRGHVAGRAPLPRPWAKDLQRNPRQWGLIERYIEPKKAMARANSHRLWAKTNKVPIEVISRTLPGNWQKRNAIVDPTPSEGFVFARWVGKAAKRKPRP